MGAWMSRCHDWPEKLADFLAARAARPFLWGETDCALTIADWVLLATGVDPAADLRGRYRTPAGARRAIRRTGSADLLALADARLGAVIPPLLAARGDIVALPGEDGPALGICIGADAVAMQTAGLVTTSMANVVRAWRV